MKKTLIMLALFLCTLTLGACESLCHGHEGSNGAAMQRFWD